MSSTENAAPGWPGIAPRWTSSAKEGVGTSASYQSRVWFTTSHGILNEVYYPRIDQANTRDVEFLVADGDQYFSEEKRDTNRRIAPLEQGVPGYRLVNSCKRGRYRMTKIVITDLERDVFLQKVHFDAGKGKLEDYGVYALLAPHIGNRGYGNNGWIGNYKGIPMLFAQREGVSLALASSTHFRKMSCGYVGVSDGWQTVTDSKTVDTGLGIHYADLETMGLSPGESIVFTFFWTEANKWEGADFQVTVSEDALTTVQTES
jgi:glucoamylase